MDFLSRMIARLGAQKACLDHAAGLIAGVPGVVLEIGLGKGRSYDRLRALFPQRTIYAFDREVHCAARLRPADAQLFLGDFRDSLPAAFERLGQSAALAHVDLGTEDLARDRLLAAAVAPLVDRLVLPGGIVLGDRPMDGPGWRALPPPAGALEFAYYLYQTDTGMRARSASRG
jgi:hypothetical protein